MDYSDVRYLLSKKPVDDRALNRVVLSALGEALGSRAAGGLSIVELGAGVGTMVARLADWHVIRSAEYTLVDRDAESLAAARDHLNAWAARAETTDQGWRVSADGATSDVRFIHSDAFVFLTAPDNHHRYDLVVANAVLDLMDLRPTLEQIWRAVKPGALYWFSINFDGETIFLPEAPLDERVMRLYHRTMDERVRDGQPCGDSKTGRHLLEVIPKSGGSLLAAGSSDWVVFPSHGKYPADEAYFLHHIVNTLWVALKDHPELAGGDFERWIHTRHEQIEGAELIYIAHQLDVVGRAPGAARA
jgi:SAM-dependent methyltransferase